MGAMKRNKIVPLCLLLLSFLTTAFVRSRPNMALVLPEGRTYDQAHNTGYLDWSGPVGYVNLTHRDGYLPAAGGRRRILWKRLYGAGHAHQQWWDSERFLCRKCGQLRSHDLVHTRLFCGNCHATSLFCEHRMDYTYTGPGGGLPGFISIVLAVPAGCSKLVPVCLGRLCGFPLSGCQLHLPHRYHPQRGLQLVPSHRYQPSHLPRPADSHVDIEPPLGTPTFTSTPTPTFTPTATATSTMTFTPTATNTFTATPTKTFTPTATNTPTAHPNPLAAGGERAGGL